MYEISSELYLHTAALLAEAIGCRGYYSGSLCFVFGDVDCRLTCSVIVYRQPISHPEGETDRITNLVPVWWEFHTVGAEGEQLNDFEFSELRELIG